MVVDGMTIESGGTQRLVAAVSKSMLEALSAAFCPWFVEGCGAAERAEEMAAVACAVACAAVWVVGRAKGIGVVMFDEGQRDGNTLPFRTNK